MGLVGSGDRSDQRGHVVNPKVSAGRRRVVQAWREPGGMSLPLVAVELEITIWSRLLQFQQFSEQDGFVTGRAGASQTEGMAKQPALWTTKLT